MLLWLRTKGISFLRLGADAGDGEMCYDKAATIKRHGSRCATP